MMNWAGASAVLLAALAVPVLVASSYLALLALLARRVLPPRARRAPTTRFVVLVPAHDEELGIAATIASLRALDYPRDLIRVAVVADNCSDGTAERARNAGAVVWERQDAVRRGKGHALAHGFATVLADGFADAVVVVDADTTVSPDLLHAFDAALAEGAEALQADYGVRNADASWRTRLVTLGFALFHGLRSVARERLGVSCGLRGNGMCFRAELLRRVPHRAFSIVEDLEYGIHLALAGVRIRYVAEARVFGDMPLAGAGARSQRDRWERGRRAIARAYAWPLLRDAVRRRDAALLDLAFDVVVPPLSRVVAAVAIGWMASVLAMLAGAPAEPAAVLWTLAAAGVAAYLARGCAMTGDGLRAAADLAWAPIYMLWKLTVLLRRTAPGGEWVRTSRVAPGTRGGR